MRDRPFFPHGTRLCDTGIHPSTVATSARPAAANGTKNPVYLINGLFSGSSENVVGMSPQRGTIDGLDALSAQVEVSSESESVCDFGGQKRFTGRKRGVPGVFSSIGQPTYPI